MNLGAALTKNLLPVTLGNPYRRSGYRHRILVSVFKGSKKTKEVKGVKNEYSGGRVRNRKGRTEGKKYILENGKGMKAVGVESGRGDWRNFRRAG